MNTLELGVRPLAAALEDFDSAWKQGRASPRARIDFASPELLLEVLRNRRLDLLRALVGAGPVSLREIARRTRRDVKAVHRDVHALLQAGLLEKTAAGRIEFPYGRIHVDFAIAPEAA
jgi:predicted transcriptional regulator